MDSPQETKVCCHCHTERSIEAFAIRSGTTKRRGSCRECQGAARDRWTAAHAEERREYQRQWCAANPDKRRAYSARQNAKPEAAARRQAWRAKQPRRLRKTEAAKEAIIREYADPTVKICDIGARYGMTGPTITEALRRWGIAPIPRVRLKHPRKPRHRPSKGKRGAHRIGKTTYDLWLAKHGREEADKLNVAMKSKMSQRCKGSGNPMYGKPPPEGAMGPLSKRNGLTGWYRDRFFRSLKELTYMMQLDAQGVTWASAEGLSIPYQWEGHSRTYHPDYRVGDTLVEIKPRRYHRDPRVLAKAAAGQTYCEARGWQYSLMDVEADMNAIYQSYVRREVRFTPFAELRFLDSCASRGMLVMY